MDIDIGKNFEREAMLEAQKEAQAAVDENAKIQSAEVVEEVTGGLGLDSKTIGITAAVLVGLFLVAGFGGDIIGMFDGIAPTSAVVADVDTLHDQNIEGTLNSEEGYMYNEFSFVLLDGLWWTELVKNRVDGQGIEIVKTPLHYGPQDVEAVTNSGVLDASFDSEIEVFLAIDPNVQNKYYTLDL